MVENLHKAFFLPVLTRTQLKKWRNSFPKCRNSFPKRPKLIFAGFLHESFVANAIPTTKVLLNKPTNFQHDATTHFQNGKTHFQNGKTHFQNAKTHFQNSKTHFQNPKTPFQNAKTHFQNAKTHFQNVETHFQNVETDFMQFFVRVDLSRFWAKKKPVHSP